MFVPPPLDDDDDADSAVVVVAMAALLLRHAGTRRMVMVEFVVVFVGVPNSTCLFCFVLCCFTGLGMLLGSFDDNNVADLGPCLQTRLFCVNNILRGKMMITRIKSID